MTCMKCGREIEESHAFCKGCLEEMEKYPVKPGTVVQLPRATSYQPTKKPAPKKKPAPSLEEQVRVLRKWARILALALVLVVGILIGAGYLAVQQYIDLEDKIIPGQNYSSAVNPTISTSDNTQR